MSRETAERALELMCRRAISKEAFGKKLADLGGNYDKIANARINIDMARLLTLQTAHVIDTRGVQEAQVWISKIKALARRGSFPFDARADGMVLLPDATAGCRCSYLNKAWFALQPVAGGSE